MKLFSQLARSLAEGLEDDWVLSARPEQLPPPGDWATWLILAGRGWGKTRTGAEWIRSIACGPTPLARGRARRIALVGETVDDAKNVMVTGVSGILACHTASFRPTWEPSNKLLTWPNGCEARIFSGSDPDQLRGPQHDAAWGDELAKWPAAQATFDQLQFGLRLGSQPQLVLTTTPRPLPLLKSIIADPSTVVTRGRTLDNSAHLAPRFLSRIMGKFEGTRLGRQELEAEILDDVPGALFALNSIDSNRILPEALPEMRRVVIAIDPAVSSKDGSDETGIIVAGLDGRGHGYVLEDLSGRYTPDGWARVAIEAYRRHRADRVVAEVNQGGAMVEATLRAADPNVAYRAVHASRGKAIRAEPVGALYEQGKVHHVGGFAVLEDQLCAFTSDFDRARSGYSPDRLDALVWAISELMVQKMEGAGLFELARQEAQRVVRRVAEVSPVQFAPGSVEYAEAQRKAGEGGLPILGPGGAPERVRPKPC